MSLPVVFSDKVRQPAGASGGYPTQLSATDLDRNFAYASIIVDDEYIERTTQNGHPARKLKAMLPAGGDDGQRVLLSIDGEVQWSDATPEEGTYIIGSENGVIKWIETFECGN